MNTGISKSRISALLLIILIGVCSTVCMGLSKTSSDSSIVLPDSLLMVDTLNISDIETPDSTAADSAGAGIDSALTIEIDSLETARSDTVSTPVLRKRSPAGAMWRSFAFPGWGQLYNRRYIKSLIIAGGEISLIAAIYVQEERRKDAKKIGDDVTARFYRSDRQRLTWWLAGAVLYSMADAYVDAHLADFDISDDLSAGIFPGFMYIRIQF